MTCRTRTTSAPACARRRPPTSAGAADRIPVVAVANLSRCLKDLQKQGVWIYVLAGEATASLYQLDLKGNIALVLGGDSLPQRKPSGEPLRHIAAHFGVPVAACLMVGDSRTD
ncbi:hypothetical protein G6F56_014064 [Rhizopus delemar]|nr:hypothetical protein G6F56_014064 [Rhizopus delemar]